MCYTSQSNTLWLKAEQSSCRWQEIAKIKVSIRIRQERREEGGFLKLLHIDFKEEQERTIGD
jgi:hypothetical protein